MEGRLSAVAVAVGVTLVIGVNEEFPWTGNLVEGVIFGMPTSGQSWSHPLLDYRPTGDPIFTGGSFGPEAGLFMTAAAVVALLVMRGGRPTRRGAAHA